MIEIDGSQGEGGGQIIRSSLTLAAVTGQSFRVSQIRAGRKRPGLLRQHLTAVRAVQEICGAEVEGAELHSSHLSLVPGPLQTRGFQFSVGSAGSAILVAQTVLPALMVADGNSSIEIQGGTHNMAAPPFEYLAECYLPLIGKMGPGFVSSIDQYGFYPAGGGRIRIVVQPQPDLRGLELMERGGRVEPDVRALMSMLPVSIGEREISLIQRKSGWSGSRFSVQEIENPVGPGNVVMIRLRFPNVTEIVTGFGRRDVTAEQVASKAWRQAKKVLATETPVGEYLTDQLLLPLAIAASQGKTSRFLTGELSRHSRTHMDIIRRFLDVSMDVIPIPGSQNEIRVGPAS